MDFNSLITLLSNEWAGEVISGGMAIICAVIGAKMATYSSKTLERGLILRDAYTAVFSGYYGFLKDESEDRMLEIASAMEVAMLLCSSQSELLMSEILDLLIYSPNDLTKIGQKMNALRSSAKADVANYLGKKRSSKVK